MPGPPRVSDLPVIKTHLTFDTFFFFFCSPLFTAVTRTPVVTVGTRTHPIAFLFERKRTEQPWTRFRQAADHNEHHQKQLDLIQLCLPPTCLHTTLHYFGAAA